MSVIDERNPTPCEVSITPEQQAAEVAYRSVVDNSSALRRFKADLNSGKVSAQFDADIKFADNNMIRLSRCAVHLTTDTALLTAMAHHREAWIRASVASNPHTPSDVRERYEGTKVQIRRSLKELQKQLFRNSSGHNLTPLKGS